MFHFKRHPQAFSLVELLFVVAVMSLVAGLVMSSVNGITRSQGMTSNISQLTGLIEQSRQAAMAQNTFVWLGIAKIQKDGNAALVVTALAGKSGMASDLSNGNCQPLITQYVLKNLTLDSASYLSLEGIDDSGNIDFGQSTLSFTRTLPGNPTPTTFQAIAFKPDGEISIGVNAKRRVGVGLSGGPSAATHRDSAAIQISVLSGQLLVFRPELANAK
jgi:prepilin-type N-terminal cleavage/methylation domain-containing protein